MEPSDVKRWYDLLLLWVIVMSSVVYISRTISSSDGTGRGWGGVLAVFAVMLVPAMRDMRRDLRELRAKKASLRRAFELACHLFDTTRWVQIVVSRTSDGYVAAAIVRGSSLAVCGQVPMSTPDGAIDSLCLALAKKLECAEVSKEDTQGWSA